MGRERHRERGEMGENEQTKARQRQDGGQNTRERERERELCKRKKPINLLVEGGEVHPEGHRHVVCHPARHRVILVHSDETGCGFKASRKGSTKEGRGKHMY